MVWWLLFLQISQTTVCLQAACLCPGNRHFVQITLLCIIFLLSAKLRFLKVGQHINALEIFLVFAFLWICWHPLIGHLSSPDWVLKAQVLFSLFFFFFLASESWSSAMTNSVLSILRMRARFFSICLKKNLRVRALSLSSSTALWLMKENTLVESSSSSSDKFLIFSASLISFSRSSGSLDDVADFLNLSNALKRSKCFSSKSASSRIYLE